MTIEQAIKNNDLESFKRLLLSNGEVRASHLLLCVVFDAKQLFQFILNNYNIENKFELLDLSCSAIALQDNFPKSKLISNYLDFLSEFVYHGTRRLVFMAWDYKGFKYILQVENPLKTEELKCVNRVLLKRFMELAEKYTDSNSTKEHFLAQLDFTLKRNVVSEEVVQDFAANQNTLEEQVMNTEVDELIKHSLKIRQEKELNELKALQTIKELQVQEEPVYYSEFEQVCDEVEKVRNSFIPGISLEDKLFAAGISIEEVIEYVHKLENR